MVSEYKHPVVIGTLILSLLAGLFMLYFHAQGFNTSIGWTLTTESELNEIIAYKFEKGPFEFQLKGERVSLTEAFFGDTIDSLDTLTLVYTLFVFLGIGVLIACSTYFKQWGFLIFSVLFALFLTQLNLAEYFDAGQWVVLIPFIILIGVAYLFQSYFKHSIFLVRIGGILGAMILLILFIPGGISGFTNHFNGYGILPLMLLVFIFLAMVSEELLFGLLYLLTRTRGARGNEKHLLLLGGLYIVNLAGYYLNKAGIFDFTFTFINPYILLFVSFCVAIWSYRYKYELTQRSIHFVPFIVILLTLGLITFSILGLGFAKGNDGIYEGIHYLIIYTHLAFGFMFLAYMVLNLIDPLIDGFQVYKILYKPQSFHYVTARLGGLAMIAAFFFLSSKAAYNLFLSAKYDFLGDIELQEGKNDLAISYYKRSDFFGYNTHYPNYQLGSIYLNKGRLPEARHHFEKASLRHPSAQAYLNSSNLQRDTGLGLSTAILEQGLLEFPDRPELINNLGVIHKKSGIPDKAFSYFKETEIEDSWNQAPQANKWSVLSTLRNLKGENIGQAYTDGNVVVRTNVISAMLSSGTRGDHLSFDTSTVHSSPYPLLKQSYLLNAAWVFADTILQNQIGLELSRPVFGLQSQLRKAQALNMYMSRKTKSAFLAYDQIQLGETGSVAGIYLNEMGMLALDQHAPMLARDFFNQAINAGNVPARLNKLVALLEAGQYQLANRFLTSLIASDTVYIPLRNSLKNVFTPGVDTTLEVRINEIYYRSGEYSPEELGLAMSPFSQKVKQMILNKLIQNLENHQDSVTMQAYAINNFKFVNYMELGKSELIKLANQQPFEEGLVLAAGEYMSESDPNGAYNLYYQTLDFNPYSIPILKALSLSAIAIGLPDYAEPYMITLSNLVTDSEFLKFKNTWDNKLEEVNDDWSF